MLWRRLCGEGPCRHPALGQPPRAPSRRPPARSPGSGVSEQPGPPPPGQATCLPPTHTRARVDAHSSWRSRRTALPSTHRYTMYTASVGAGAPGGGLLRASGRMTAGAHLTCCHSTSDLAPVLTGRPWCCLQGGTVGTCWPRAGGSPCPSARGDCGPRGPGHHGPTWW